MKRKARPQKRRQTRLKKPLPVGVVWWRPGQGHPMRKHFGPEVQTLRKERGWTLDDLHTITGLAKSTLSELENGRSQPSLEDILALEAAFGLTPGELEERVARRWMQAEPGVRSHIHHRALQARRLWRRGQAWLAWLVSGFSLWATPALEEV